MTEAVWVFYIVVSHVIIKVAEAQRIDANKAEYDRNVNTSQER